MDAVPDSLAGISIDSKLLLQSLRLRYNTIRSLSASHFRRFSIIDSVDLAGNPISNIQVGILQGHDHILHELQLYSAFQLSPIMSTVDDLEQKDVSYGFFKSKNES